MKDENKTIALNWTTAYILMFRYLVKRMMEEKELSQLFVMEEKALSQLFVMEEKGLSQLFVMEEKGLFQLFVMEEKQ